MAMHTNRLLAGLIVQIVRLQTHRAEAAIEVLAGLGLTPREIASVIGSTEASVAVRKSRALRKRKTVIGSADHSSMEPAS